MSYKSEQFREVIMGFLFVSTLGAAAAIWGWQQYGPLDLAVNTQSELYK